MSINYGNLTAQQAYERNWGSGELSPFEVITERTYHALVPRSMLNYMDQDRWREDFITGDRDYDRNLFGARLPAYITIEHMLNIWDNGYAFKLLNEADGQEIYNVVKLHLRCCLLHNQDPFAGEPCNIAVLSKMDEFLGSVFPAIEAQLNKPTFDEHSARDRFNRKMGTLSKAEKSENRVTEHEKIIAEATIGSSWEKSRVDDGLGDFDFGGEEWH